MLQNIYLIQIIFIKSIENLLSYNEKKNVILYQILYKGILTKKKKND